MEVIELWPLSRAETLGTSEDFVDRDPRVGDECVGEGDSQAEVVGGRQRLAASVLRQDGSTTRHPDAPTGRLVETFALMKIRANEVVAKFVEEGRAHL